MDKSLERIEPFYVLGKVDSNDSVAGLLDQHYPRYRRLTDRVVKEKKKELIIHSQKVFAQVGELFAESLPIFNMHQTKMKDAA